VSSGQPFDIFRVDQKGGVVWCAAANSLDETKATVEQFSKIEPGIEFVIMNQETKEQIAVKPVLLSHATHAPS
jgi:hypothetical protein